MTHHLSVSLVLAYVSALLPSLSLCIACSRLLCFGTSPLIALSNSLPMRESETKRVLEWAVYAARDGVAEAHDQPAMSSADQARAAEAEQRHEQHSEDKVRRKRGVGLRKIELGRSGG